MDERRIHRVGVEVDHHPWLADEADARPAHRDAFGHHNDPKIIVSGFDPVHTFRLRKCAHVESTLVGVPRRPAECSVAVGTTARLVVAGHADGLHDGRREAELPEGRGGQIAASWHWAEERSPGQTGMMMTDLVPKE
eukprot:scaffold201556_cov28-Tisochrysis_lutea.AAC.2